MSHMHTRFTNHSLLNPGERVTDDQFTAEANQLMAEENRRHASRRSFITKLTAGAAAVGSTALFASLTGCSNDGAVTITANGPSVFDVLNFALNLEYLEAAFYLYITTGAGIPTANQGTSPGTVTGTGSKLTFTNAVVGSLANQLATHESQHVALLRTSITTLGGTPVSMPNINLAAMGTPTSDATFLALSRQLETVGVSAYAGGAQYLTSNTTALLYAAQILDTEAQHEGFLRQLCVALNVASPAVDGMDTPPTSTTLFNTSATTGLNPVRTTSQVLQIVYGNKTTGVSSGGFFPSGLNGTIRTS